MGWKFPVAVEDEILVEEFADAAAKKMRKLRRARKGVDDEHIEADKILCDLLRQLDCGKVVDEYEKIQPKYYA